MAKKTYRQQAQEMAKRVEASLRNRQRLMPEYDLEDFGLSIKMLDNDNVSPRQAKKNIALMEEYLSNPKKYGVTDYYRNKDKPMYTTNQKVQEWKDYETAYLKAKLALNEAKVKTLKTYKGIDEHGNIEVRDYDTSLNKDPDSAIRIYTDKDGNPFINKNLLKKIEKSNTAVTFTKLPYNKFDERLTNLKIRANDYTYKHASQYMANYLDVLATKIDSDLAVEIAKVINKNKITPMEFLYLYYSSEVFNISFLYTTEQVRGALDMIKSEVENLRKTDMNKFTDFVSEAFGDDAENDKFSRIDITELIGNEDY